MPNPRKPTALKLLEGTARPDRARVEAELPEASDTSPPDWLTTDEARAEWARVVALLTPVRVLSAGDLSALGHLCQLHGECVRLWREGAGGPTAAQLTQLRLYWGEFGLTPASRSKAGVLGGEKKSAFSEFRQAK